MSKNRYYAVVKGNQPGIYNEWFGPHGAESQIKGVARAVFKGFPTCQQAEAWYVEKARQAPIHRFPAAGSGTPPVEAAEPSDIQSAGTAGRVVIFTDGACTGNPGPGGYGAVVLDGQERTELSGGYRLTTNNRMELLACIQALQTLKRKSSVVLYSDSRYVVQGIRKGWARRWKARGWMRNQTQEALNADLWARLLDLCAQHEVEFTWVAGHAGIPENERCDQLSVRAAQKQNLPPDHAYENPQKIQPGLFMDSEKE